MKNMFQNVVMADAGDYQCQASNKFAKNITSSKCKMQIRRKWPFCFLELKCQWGVIWRNKNWLLKKFVIWYASVFKQTNLCTACDAPMFCLMKGVILFWRKKCFLFVNPPREARGALKECLRPTIHLSINQLKC